MNIVTNILIIFMPFVLSLSAPAHGQQEQQYEITQPYQYPCRPGMDCWAEFKSQAEKTAACQVPEEILSKMSTKALVQTCVNYPLVPIFWAYNSYEEGQEAIIQNSNAHLELLDRADVGFCLLEKYKELGPESYNNSWNDYKKGLFKARYMHIEMLIGNDRVFSQMTEENKYQLLIECVRKFEYRMLNLSIYGQYSLELPAFLAGRVLLENNYESFASGFENNDDLKQAIRGSAWNDGKLINDVMQKAKKYAAVQMGRDQ